MRPSAAAGAPSSGSRLDPHVHRYATRTAVMPAPDVRSGFAVGSRPWVVAVAGGMPNISGLPLDSVGQMMNGVVQDQGMRALQYGSGQGELPLREQIVDVMRPTGIHAHPDDVTITVGSQHGLDLVAKIFLDPGDVVLAEAPSYVTALGTFRSYQADVVHVAMDDDGIIPGLLAEAIDAVRADGRTLKFLYTIPSFQNPAGSTLTPQRRAEVLEICRRADVLIIEDDPYGLLGFDGQVPRALRADDSERVVYLGTFSKTFAPGLRVGWVLAPHAVREKLVLASENAILSPPTFSQFAMSSYLADYDWMAQVKAFREQYRDRRDAILTALDDVFPPGAHWTRPTGGFYVWLTLPEGIDTKAMLPRAVTNRVAYVPGTAFYADGRGRASMRLSFCYPTPEQIREGVRRLVGAIEGELDLRDTFGSTLSPSAEGSQAPAADLP